MLAALTHAQQARLTSRGYFPSLISDPFKHGLTIILVFSIAMCLLAGLSSWLRGAKYIYHEPDPTDGDTARHTRKPPTDAILVGGDRSAPSANVSRRTRSTPP